MIGNVIGNVIVIDPVIVAALVSGNDPVDVIDLAWTSTQLGGWERPIVTRVGRGEFIDAKLHA